MLRFSIFGITVNIQPMFWLIMAMIGGAIPLLSKPTTAGLVNLIVFIGAGFLSILIHELGHALTMKRFRKAPEIILHGMGGIMVSSGPALKKSQNFWVIIMGPLAQFGIGSLALILLTKVNIDIFPTPQSRMFIVYLMSISFFWSLLNLLPIYPLDGGLLLKNFLKKTRLVHLISLITIGLLILICLKIGQIFSIIILLMLGSENYKAFQTLKQA